MSYQAQVVINGTTIYHLMVRPGTLAIIGTTECKRITGTTCFNIYYWLNDTSIYHFNGTTETLAIIGTTGCICITMITQLDINNVL